jgi:hypothetical protein
MRRALLLGVAVAVVLAAAPAANAARFAVGLKPGADAAAVRAALAARGLGRGESLAPVPAVVVDAPSRAALRGLREPPTSSASARARPPTRPIDPLASRQWYLAAKPRVRRVDGAAAPRGHAGGGDRLGCRRRPSRPGAADRELEELRRQLAAVDRQGHGTFVAGLIAAESDNGIGIAGMSPAADLLIAKVVTAARRSRSRPRRRRSAGPSSRARA